LILWAQHDIKKNPPFQIHSDDARRWNEKGYGIFWTPNTHQGARLGDHVVEIRFWFCELDDENKEKQLVQIRKTPLRPTHVIESKRGYQCYWRAADGRPKDWDRIVKRGLVPWMDSDSQASDMLRLLRYPGFHHCKGEQYLVRTVWNNTMSYTTAQMLRAYPDSKSRVGDYKRGNGDGNDFWSRARRLDAREALLQLNGHWLMNKESFELKEMGNGNANIFRIDGASSRYSTGCFIDPEGRIGNCSKGSSIIDWCEWYGWSPYKIAQGLKEVFNELEREETIPTSGDNSCDINNGIM